MRKFIFCAVIALAPVLPAWSQEDTVCSSVPLTVLLNYLPGFGIGSFIQGDTCGGTIQLVTELVGVGCLVVAASTVSGVAQEEKPTYMAAALALGAIPVGAGVVFGLIRPIWYCCKHQQAQKVETLSCRLLPAIMPSIDRRGFDIAVELSLTRPPG